MMSVDPAQISYYKLVKIEENNIPDLQELGVNVAFRVESYAG